MIGIPRNIHSRWFTSYGSKQNNVMDIYQAKKKKGHWAEIVFESFFEEDEDISDRYGQKVVFMAFNVLKKF